MAENWNGKTYDADYYPIDAWGVRQGDKDWAASDALAHPGQGAQTPWSSSSSVSSTSPGPQSDFGKQVQGKLSSELNLDPNVNTNDPAYRQQVDAFNWQSDRTADRQRAATAQRMQAQGTLTGGGLDTAVQRGISDQGAQNQQFEGQLMGKFRDQNLQRMARALELGTGLLSQEQEQALRATLTREGYGLQDKLGTADLNFRRDALGQQSALSQAQLDQQALLALLNG